MPSDNTLPRVVLSWSLLLSPMAAARAGEPSAATDYLTPKSVAAITVRVAEVAETPIAQALPIEVLDAALQKYVGIPLAAIDRVTLVAEPPAGINPLYAVVINTTEQARLDQLPPELTEHTIESELEGRPLLESQQRMLPSIGMLNERTIAIGPKVFLKRLLKQEPQVDSKLAKAMTAKGGSENHLHAALMLEPLRGLIQMGMTEAMKDAPPETHKYFDAPNLISGAILAADLTFERDSSLTVYANDESDGERLNALIEEGIAELRDRSFDSLQYLELANSDDPVKRATAEYMDRLFGSQIEAYKPIRLGSKAFVLGEMKGGDGPGQMASNVVIGFMFALLLPAIQAAREAARQMESSNNMKQIILGMLNYEFEHGRFPAQAICADDGTPLLSWRVAVLPYIQEQELYAKFKLDEPWNSPNNRPLIAEMPAVYIDPSTPSLAQVGGKTHYLGIAGPNAVFTGECRGIKLDSITDGASLTIAVVQVDDAHSVEWTKPVDFDAVAKFKNPAAAIGSLHPGIILVGYCSGRILNVPLDTDISTLRAAMTRNGGERLQIP